MNQTPEETERHIKKELSRHKSTMNAIGLLIQRQGNHSAQAKLQIVRMLLEFVTIIGCEFYKDELTKLEDLVYILPDAKRELYSDQINSLQMKIEENRNGILDLSDSMFSHVTDDIINVIDDKLEQILLHPNGKIAETLISHCKQNL